MFKIGDILNLVNNQGEAFTTDGIKTLEYRVVDRKIDVDNIIRYEILNRFNGVSKIVILEGLGRYKYIGTFILSENATRDYKINYLIGTDT